MKEPEKTQPAGVASGPKQAGDIRDRWWWVEHTVWTGRMLGRLEASGPTTNWFELWSNRWFAEQGLYRLSEGTCNNAWSHCQTPSSGKPDAGEPPVRFGGRGGGPTSAPTQSSRADD